MAAESPASIQFLRHDMNSRPTYLCRTCGKVLHSRSTLSVHERRHIGKSPYRCCGKSFFSHTLLVRHRCSRHNIPKRYKCSQCNYACGIQSDLNLHNTRVHSERRFSCEICGQKFPTEGQRDDHVDSHSGEKRHKCECGKAFRYSSGLSRHKKTCQK